MTIDRAEAVRTGWNESAPPDRGWEPVQLVDFWDRRWPDHDGVVWYRLRWQQADARQPIGLLVNYICLSGAIYVNGNLVARDPSLVEPLSRAWVAPYYQLIPSALLRQGENTLLVRVSGLSAYQPGFGTVTVGEPAAVQALYRQERFARHDIKLINVAMSVVMGGLFLMLWLFRRQDSVYGWFALSELAGSLYGANYIVSSPWPFTTTDGWQAFVVAMYLVTGASYTMFLFRYAERRFPRIETMMALVSVAAVATALLAPGWMGPARTPWIVVGGLFFYLGIGYFLAQAWRRRRIDFLVLAACLLLPVLVSFYDFALFFGWVHSDTYLLSLTSVLTLVGIGFVLSHRFVTAMRRIEGFNDELRQEVVAATSRLSDTLSQQHALELAHGRAGERLQLVRDLHDGFGGTLVGAIAQLENAPEDTTKAQIVGTLKEMRDDLRLVIDSTAREQAALAAQLAPLRHRLGRLLETADIDSRWQLEGLEGIELGPARSLDLMRLLQEALTNVFKHSRARQVNVRLARADDRLQLHIEDDGQGLVGEGDGLVPGAGLGSMRARAQRLGGQLRIESNTGGTRLRLEFPLLA
ncbi:ATP-binding protein [Pseudoxanthomonas sp. z9]|uniref:sensor histidine kinase n=1 Tax=Pseudoxanthomonas sp. z9 TaxID=2584942 RepID=UPI0015E8BB9D|nr:ATP-binding protein [Pseudoxanthomonas sp. z9]